MMVDETTYKKSGVDIEKGERLVKRIASLARTTFDNNVLQDIGGFGSLFSIDTDTYKEPVLVSGTDGVGTKLKVAFMTDKHDTIGIDLVAMCVNDILTSGARPLFFLDYFATGRLDEKKAADVIKGIAEGCGRAHCSLIGGETAEMPDFYAAGEYDIAGFAVGVVNKSEIIDGREISDGDVIIGISSSGIHSNGYSLVREVLFNVHKYAVDTYVEELGKTIGEELLTPTAIYVDAVNALKRDVRIKAMAHITGGGVPGNLVRSIPDGYGAVINEKGLPRPPVFDFVARLGNVSGGEMRRTFNMGIGYTFVVGEGEADKGIEIVKGHGYNCGAVGRIEKGGRGVRYAED